MTDLTTQGWNAGCIRHTHPLVEARLRDSFAALASCPVWVRPAKRCDDGDRVPCKLRTLSPGGRVLVSDLWEPRQRDPRGGVESAIDLQDRWLAYQTSGSTGSSKCVVYRETVLATHAARVAQAALIACTNQYVALPSPSFAYGLSIAFSHALSGVPVLFTDAPSMRGDLREWTSDGRLPLALYLLPQQVPMLLNARLDPGRVERVLIAGGRISGPSVQALAKKFPNLRLSNMYGQAEMGPRLSVWDGDPKDFVEGSIGKPISGVQLMLADEERGRTEPVPLLASSEHAMWKCLKPPYEEFEDGPAPGEFIDTGDLAMRAPDGGLIHCGRGDHVLNVAGTKIDVRRVTSLIEERFRPIVVRITSKPSRVAGDVLPVVEIVPSPDERITKRDVRQTLHADYGSLASLFDVQIVSQLNLGESGK